MTNKTRDVAVALLMKCFAEFEQVLDGRTSPEEFKALLITTVDSVIKASCEEMLTELRKQTSKGPR